MPRPAQLPFGRTLRSRPDRALHRAGGSAHRLLACSSVHELNSFGRLNLLHGSEHLLLGVAAGLLTFGRA
eukprot:12289506-Alexandrium_andersonii.AAC.1